jgi:chitinase
MIGKNDDAEIFSLDDAKNVAAFAGRNHVGLVSFWSIDRDQPGTDYNVSSTVQSKPFEFNAIFQASH